jgi:hypothetical protein
VLLTSSGRVCGNYTPASRFMPSVLPVRPLAATGRT